MSNMQRAKIDINTGFFINDYTERDIEQLVEKISKFDVLTEDEVKRVDLERKITDVMLIRSLLVYPNHYTECTKNTTFFRVRSLNHNIDYKTQINKEQDCWEPPSECVKTPGRLNKIGESLLYTVPVDLYTALDEAQIQTGENCLLIVYKAKKSITLNMIGGKYRYKWHGIEDDRQIRIYELLNSFLNDLFRKVVTEDNLYWYCVTEKIVNDYFSSSSCAWCYSSIKNSNRMNVCFKPIDAKNSLDLLGACIVKRISKNKIELCDLIDELSISRERLVPLLKFTAEDVKYDYNNIFIDTKDISTLTMKTISADIGVTKSFDEKGCVKRSSQFGDSTK